MSLRRVRPDGAIGDLVGFVLSADDVGLRLQDRHGEHHRLEWEQLLAWRTVGVARGRDPRRTPPAELTRLAELAGCSGSYYVARLYELLDHRPAALVSPPGAPPPIPAWLGGEWVVADAGTLDEVVALAWWAAHRDARSLLLVTSDPAREALLRDLGFRPCPT